MSAIKIVLSAPFFDGISTMVRSAFITVIVTRKYFIFERKRFFMLSNLLQEKGEFELKYTYPNLAAPTISSWLRLNCKLDRQYPESRVQSIYLETLNADAYFEKANSDFFKTKFRVRWYELPNAPKVAEDDETPFFLEKKMKVGAKRLKQRWVKQEKKERSDKMALSSAFHQKWYGLFAEENTDIPQLQPFIQISYIRKRFIDQFSGARLSLDFNIRVEKSNQALLPPPTNFFLPTAVFEVKSGSDTPPQALHFLTTTLVRKANFSKYESCVSHLLSSY